MARETRLHSIGREQNDAKAPAVDRGMKLSVSYLVFFFNKKKVSIRLDIHL